jgi:hypothetical protein
VLFRPDSAASQKKADKEIKEIVAKRNQRKSRPEKKSGVKPPKKPRHGHR